MVRTFVLRLALLVPMAIGCNQLTGCRSAQTHGSSAQTEVGPVPSVRIALNAYGLPRGFFQEGAGTRCSGQIIGYRFLVWLDNQNVAIGFNTSPNCRQSPDL
jgi:hypothetical protein